MKNRKINVILASVLCVSALLAPMGVNAAGKTADDYFTTTCGSYKDEVTIGLKLEKNSKITSAQTVIYYDPAVMKLDDVTDVSGIGLTDVNEAYVTEDGRTGVSFAWASDKPVTKGGQVLTVVFKVKDAKNGQVVSIETDTLNAYKDGVELDQSEKKDIHNETLSIPDYTGLGKNGNAANNALDKIMKGINKGFNIFKGIFGTP